LRDTARLTPEIAKQVDDVLVSYWETSFLRVDPARWENSGEAWVYVIIEPGDSCPLRGEGPWKGSAMVRA
jgi:hypothetical protein